MPSKKEIKQRSEFQTRLGIHIRSVRKTHNLTQEELSDKSGIIRSNIARLEVGQKNPSIFILTKLAAGMKISLSRLLKGFK